MDALTVGCSGDELCASTACSFCCVRCAVSCFAWHVAGHWVACLIRDAELQEPFHLPSFFFRIFELLQRAGILFIKTFAATSVPSQVSRPRLCGRGPPACVFKRSHAPESFEMRLDRGPDAVNAAQTAQAFRRDGNVPTARRSRR